jgi:DNA-binding MarR family transcriptional regulator
MLVTGSIILSPLQIKYLQIERTRGRVHPAMVDVKSLDMENQPMTTSIEPDDPGPDRIDAQLAVWRRELPGLDLEIEGIVERIGRLERIIERTTEETLAAYDLSFGEWRLMGSLRYGGPPYRGKPGKLARWLGLSSGAMTNRLDRMEARGLIRRHPDPDDRRGVLVELTDEGGALWEASVEAQAQKEAVVGSALDRDEQARLNELLRRLLHAFETHHGPPGPKKAA